MRTKTILGAVIFFSAAACGGGEEPAKTGGTTTTGTAQAKDKDKVPALKLGHYSSPDGSVGLVLDRTSDKPKIRMDGSKDIVEAFVEDEVRGGDVVARKYRGADTKIILRVDAHGGVELYRNVGTVHLVRDADADALGAATQVGVAAPPSDREVLDKKYAGLTVMKRFPEFKPQDSGNLAKVKEAFSKATKDMWLTFQPGKENYEPIYSPASGHIDNTIHAGAGLGGHPAEDGWEKNSQLAKFGAVVRGATIAPEQSMQLRTQSHVESGTTFLSNSNTNIRMYDLKATKKPLAAGTPGLLWETDDGLVFVTVDGGRYRVVHYQDAPFVEGVAAPSSWPPPLQHSLLDRDSLDYLVKGNASQTKAATELDAIEKRYQECSDKTWNASKDQFKGITTADLQWHTKAARGGVLAEKIVTQVDKACGKEVAAYEKALVGAIEARNKERTALYEDSKATAAKAR